MAEWLARDEDEAGRKDCKLCKTLANIDSYESGAQVFVGGLFDCENCIVAKSVPIPDNDIILDIYTSLPQNFDGMTGFKILTSQDIINILRVFEVDESLWYDYYNRLAYFHECIVNARSKKFDSKKKKDNKKVKGAVKDA